MVVVNRAARRRAAAWRVGAGVVIAHPEVTVRQRTLSQTRGLFGRGYYVSGVALQAAAARQLVRWRRLAVSVEAKLSAAYARVPIADGHATVPNAALHVLAGAGYAF
jgi:hypothetical protein